jgi:Uncharacterized protein conserved in bacteria (DUF2066)
MLEKRRFAWVLAGMLAAAGPAAAQSRPDVFTVSPVPVDVTAQSASAARDQALAEGEHSAFQTLFERLSPSGGRAHLPRVTGSQLADLVSGFEVANERRSGVRYLASYTFHFQPDAVRQLLTQAGVPFAETASKPLVVLAVWRDGDNVTLWESPNPWRDAWGRAKLPPGLVPLVIPLGELGDLQAIDADAAARGDDARLQAISARYDGADILVTEAERKSGGTSLAVTSDRYVPGTVGAAQHWSADVPPPATGDVMTAAAVDTASRLEEAWKAANMLDPRQNGRLLVQVPAATLGEWVAVRDRLNGIPAVRGLQLLSLDRGGAKLEIAYVGDAAQLRQALAQRDLELSGNDPDWVLRRRTGGSSVPR